MIVPPQWTPSNPRFRSFYGWNDADGSWTMNHVDSRSGAKIGVHRFSPPGLVSRGTLFLIHGYLEHSALRVPLAAEAVRAGWDVCAMDLPGHGLSSGPRADIDDFFEYVQALKATIQSEPWKRPWRAAGHSTGCAVFLLYSYRYGNPFEWTLLEAPLIRTVLWKPTVIAKKLLRGALNTLPRRNSNLPRNMTFYRLLFRDPLYMDRVPITWFDALERYVERSSVWKELPGCFIVLQGDDDTVVDWPYNIPFLRKRLPQGDMVMISGGKHHLLRDEGPAGDLARAAVRLRW